MGIAAYNRGSAAISRQFQDELDASRATLDNRAQLWKKAMEMGGILQFRVAGDVVTCGPYQTATGAPGYLAIRYGKGRFAGEFQGRSAWGVALWVLEHVGRARPFKAEF
jgi:hypothetical protein